MKSFILALICAMAFICTTFAEKSHVTHIAPSDVVVPGTVASTLPAVYAEVAGTDPFVTIYVQGFSRYKDSICDGKFYNAQLAVDYTIRYLGLQETLYKGGYRLLNYCGLYRDYYQYNGDRADGDYTHFIAYSISYYVGDYSYSHAMSIRDKINSFFGSREGGKALYYLNATYTYGSSHYFSQDHRCYNGFFDRDIESDTDCGKSCNPCPYNYYCSHHSDCASAICLGKGFCA